MIDTFTLAGKLIEAADFDFNTVCDLDEMGVALSTRGSTGMALLRAYVAVCADTTKTDAGKMIEEHIAGGGNLDQLSEVVGKKLNESGFFRRLSEGQTQVEQNQNETSAETGAAE